jgi:phage terminase large subunit-like protein
LRVLSGKPATAHGKNMHLGLIDEVHALPTRELVDVLTTSMASTTRKQPCVIYTTTADYARPSICNELLAQAQNVLLGVSDRNDFLPVVYETEPSADWKDPDVWAAANPNLDVSVSRAYIERECKKAQEVTAYENTFRRLHLNTVTEQAERWLSMEQWDKCAGNVREEDLIGKKCVAAIDLANNQDFNAFVLAFPIGDRVKLLPFFFLPREFAIEKERKTKAPLLAWGKQGYIDFFEGVTRDDEYVYQAMKRIMDRHNVVSVVYDRWGANFAVGKLMDDGIEVLEFGQGYKSMNPAAVEFERLLIAGKLEHGDNPVLKWMAANTAIETDSTMGIKPSKKRSFEKIDGIVASIMGIGELLRRREIKHVSVYTKRGVRTV